MAPVGPRSPGRIVGDGKLPDLRMQFAHRLRAHLRRLACRSTLEDARRPLEQRLLPLMDRRRMDLEPCGQPGHRPLATQRLQRHLRLERGRVPLPLCQLVRPLEEQKTSDRSLRQWPICGEHLSLLEAGMLKSQKTGLSQAFTGYLGVVFTPARPRRATATIRRHRVIATSPPVIVAVRAPRFPRRCRGGPRAVRSPRADRSSPFAAVIEPPPPSQRRPVRPGGSRPR